MSYSIAVLSEGLVEYGVKDATILFNIDIIIDELIAIKNVEVDTQKSTTIAMLHPTYLILHTNRFGAP